MNRIRCLVSLLTVSLMACSGPPSTNDAGDATTSDVLVFPDVAQDGRLSVSTYRACNASSDCDQTPNTMGVPEICDVTYPGGMCRRVRCTDSGQCGPLGTCSLRDGCVPRCTRQSDTCTQYAAVCLAFQIPFLGSGGCFPACDPNAARSDGGGAADGGARGCLNDLVCDPYAGRCVGRPTTSGAENGAACTGDGECRSNICIPETDVRIDVRPTGFLGGYCVSHAPLPADSVFAARRGMTLPTSTCPSGTVVLPDPDAAPGSAARCFKACVDDSACRQGYRCDRTGSGTSMFANGGCVPIDCAAAGASCPAGTQCQRADADAGALFVGSRCVRSNDGGSATDASADAASDGAADSAAGTDAGLDAAG